MKSIMQIISPQQQAKFLLWIENNQPTMQVLSHLWSQAHEEKPSTPTQQEEL